MPGSLGQKIVIEELKEQHGLAAAPDPCEDLDVSVPHMAYQALGMEVSLDNDKPRVYDVCVATFVR